MTRVLLVFLTILLLCPIAVFSEDTVVAKIGDRKITLSDFNRWMSYSTQSGGKTTAVDNKRKAAMLNQIVTGMVIADLARKEGFHSRPDISEKLELLINNFLTLEYLDKVVSADVKASEDDIQQYFEQHKDDFRTRESVHARHILIKAEKTASDSEKADARKKAEVILGQLRNGGDFQALASEHSEDPGSNTRGGDLGFFGRGRMVPEFEAVAFSLPPGKVSDIVETNSGYHIIRVEERREASVKPVEDVRTIIEGKLTRDRRRKAVDEFVTKAMNDAKAEIDVKVLVGSDPHF